VTTKRTATKLTVCILSPHPLVLSEFERILAKSQFKVIIKQLESTLAPDSVPWSRQSSGLRHRRPCREACHWRALGQSSRTFSRIALIVVGEQHNEANSFSLLRLGVKGLLTYVEAANN